MRCRLCPRNCNADRVDSFGFCGAQKDPRVVRSMLHHWEEPFLSGARGAGAVFFSGCNLGCVFCQNGAIHDATVGTAYDASALAELFLSLQQQGANNIDLVTPTPHVPVLRKAILKAKQEGLTVPVVYNCGGYEKASVLRSLEGLVDIYLPDIKYVSSTLSARFSGAADYFAFAAPAVEEMFRQVGLLTLNENGVALRGLAIRHLVLPCCIDDSRRVLCYIREHFPAEIQVSLMRQYAPTESVAGTLLDRKITDREYDRIILHALDLGLTNILIQDKSSASLEFTPLFTNWQ